jgi:hypothetical protein
LHSLSFLVPSSYCFLRLFLLLSLLLLSMMRPRFPFWFTDW